MKRQSRNRPLVYVTPVRLRVIANEQGLWFESEIERRTEIRRAVRAARRLRWVKAQMARRLEPMEREILQLHYFQGLSIRDIAQHAGIKPAAVYRHLEVAVIKLRKAAREDNLLPRRQRIRRRASRPPYAPS